MNTKQKGDIGVAMAIAYYTKSGYIVSPPLSDNARYDLLLEKSGEFIRVQCKYAGAVRSGNNVVQLRTMGSNGKWAGTTKKISSDEIDVLFIFAASGKMYEFDVKNFDGATSIRLGPKYDKNIVATWT